MSISKTVNFLPSFDPPFEFPLLERSQARLLKPSDVHVLKEIRLEALWHEGKFFASSYEKEAKLPDEYWAGLCNENPNNCMIGLFCDDKLVGITGLTTWDEDITEQTALFGRSYIKLGYRKQGLSPLLYKKRIDAAQLSPNFTRAVVFHREGNFVSRKVNMRHGAVYWRTIPMLWGDGQTANGLWYTIEL